MEIKKELFDAALKDIIELADIKNKEGIEKYGLGEIKDPLFEFKCEIADAINYMVYMYIKIREFTKEVK